MIHNEFRDVFSGIGCFKGTFKLKLREASWLNQAPQRRMTYAFHELLKEELEKLQKQQIIVPLAVYEMSEWCKSFV